MFIPMHINTELFNEVVKKKAKNNRNVKSWEGLGVYESWRGECEIDIVVCHCGLV